MSSFDPVGGVAMCMVVALADLLNELDVALYCNDTLADAVTQLERFGPRAARESPRAHAAAAARVVCACVACAAVIRRRDLGASDERLVRLWAATIAELGSRAPPRVWAAAYRAARTVAFREAARQGATNTWCAPPPLTFT